MNCIVCVTGQHREMLDQVLDVFKITPDYNFSIMKKSDLVWYHLSGYGRNEKVLKQEKPDVVLVHGDTTTTFAAALACFYEKIPVGHVEAGLRTYNIYSPFQKNLIGRRLILFHHIILHRQNVPDKICLRKEKM